MTPRHDLRARGDHELRDLLLAERAVTRAIEQLEKQGVGDGARRHLLATAMRLTPEMAPELHAIVDGCRNTLGVDSPPELFVFPSADFNAGAVRPEKGRLFLIVSSSLLEGFEPEELRFIVGHEVGHFLFEHHAIPGTALLSSKNTLDAALTLRLFAWQRYAEISADRAGLVCAGRLDPAARALFKLASGLTGDRVQVRIDQFLAQVGELRREADIAPGGDTSPRADWFATYPFSPLRLKAAELCAESELMTEGGMPIERLEAEVHDLMTLMDPSYLKERSDVAETMRRLLFAGGVAVATAAGDITQEAVDELERLLGLGSVPPQLKPEAILADLPSRTADVRKSVPLLRRAQVIRDLCVIARADGHTDESEIAVIQQIAADVGVDDQVVNCALDPSSCECVTAHGAGIGESPRVARPGPTAPAEVAT